MKATATKRPAPPRSDGEALAIHRFSVEEYQRLDDAGFFDSQRVELLEGYLVDQPTMNPPHYVCLRFTTQRLEAIVPQGWCVRPEGTVALSDSQPRPDVTVAVGRTADYADHHPRPAEIGLVVEISDSSLHADRTRMLRIYASARLPVYWIINIPERQIEIHTRPRAGQNPTYRQREVFTAADSVSFALGDTTIGPIAVVDLLPPV